MLTKFGNAEKLVGYYRISTRKEGNHGKYLHCLIWEDWYGKPVPDGYVIHHLNGDKTDNRIQNLQCVESSLHRSFHNKGKVLSEETKEKISKNNARYWKGKTFSEEHRRKKGLAQIGRVVTEETRNKIREAQIGKINSEESMEKMSMVKSTTGYFRVSKHKKRDCRQGFVWIYQYYEKGKRKQISSIDLEKLKEKVELKNLPWKKFDVGDDIIDK